LDYLTGVNLQTLRRALRPVDALIGAFIVILTIIAAAAVPWEETWRIIIPFNLAMMAVVGILSLASHNPRLKLLRFLHTWYPVPTIFLVFKEVYVIIQTIGRKDVDSWFIGFDHAMFGVNPTEWIGRFASPFLTEILQIAYVSYYLILLTVGIELYLKREQEKFSFVVFAIVYGFFLSYLGYIAFPAVGPRFTLHSFGSLNQELPGMLFTNALRDFLNAGESIGSNAVNALAVAQRDAFPSGHTEMTLIALYFAGKYRLRSRYVLYAAGTLLIISTVYLRYHYVVDLLAGAALMAFVVMTAPKLFDWWQNSGTTAIGGNA
jgi:membrane-associated phospholipid phosphatase